MQTQYLLDTNICIYISKHQPENVRQHFEKHLPNRNILISVITLGELRFGAEKSQSREKALKVIDEFTSMIQVAELGEDVADHYAQIRRVLSAKGQIIGSNDLWLAAHARANNWVMVTNNEKEFLRVEGLQVENWVSDSL
ncbi:type II toxin-antitoxin system tRNA(fMet)-specific endonuclease VapC [Acinetobacter higginsii]|uniref:type II toxin-antitoxin system tRNA(fMet)-specific endonuclease VapC n=1 Tax=Acinetobacter higginsii TaxID=70347 RepID=UPI001F61B96E|nr:type II toxin-antitoxin system VapC family toxin [Acinetobacter higginsii]MCI3880048.1 type II toxin-antitoxin system VapC family toxin [Acinetobacter higginsii]